MLPTPQPEKYWRYPACREEKLQQLLDRPSRSLINRSTPVTSLGSCFAEHIRMRLKDRGFNYVITEANDAGASANWGRVHNPVSMRQVIDYCEDWQWRPVERWWRDSNGGTVDPYRAVAPYPDEVAAAADFRRHQEEARAAFVTAGVVVLTYGLAEVWESTRDGAVFHGRPLAYDSQRHRFRVLEYPECLAAVEATCAGIRRLNPAAAVVLTVSPVPLRATFRPEVTAVTANCYSKAVLIAAVQTVALRMLNVHYFPSYEIVMECIQDPLRSGGGVTQEAVELVMKLFEKQFAEV